MADERVTVEVDGRRLTLSNLDKVLYPRPTVHPVSARPRSSTTTRGSPRSCCRTWPAARRRSPAGRTASTGKTFFEKNAPVAHAGVGPPGPAALARLRDEAGHHRLRRRRRPRHAGLGGEPGGAGAARAAVAGRRGRRAGRPRPARARPRPGTARDRRRVLRGRRCCCASGWPRTGWTRTRRPAAPRGCSCYVPLEPTPAERTSGYAKSAGRRAGAGAPRAGGQPDGQGPAAGQGVRRLVAEQRGQDHGGAVLAARPAVADRVHAADLGRGGGVPGRRGPAVRRGAGARSGSPRTGICSLR